MDNAPKLGIDKVLDEYEINLKFNIPGIDFKTDVINDQSRFHYKVTLYQKENGKKYYLFEDFDDCTLFIMNCNKAVYKELEKYLEINDDIDMWQFINNEGELQQIPKS